MKSILLVEDDIPLVSIIESVLKDEGYSVNNRTSAEEAIRYCATHVPDLIISDVNMGTMDGFSLLRTIHATDNLRKIPFVFITGLEDIASRKIAKELGAAAYIAKPFDLDSVLLKIKEILH